MNKYLKIAIITITSVIVVLFVAVSIAVWVVFTPSKLTPIVREKMAAYITCKSKLTEVELTFFSTFPQFGLKIHKLELVNPMTGAQSDTLLTADNLVASINFDSWRKDNEIILNDFTFTNLKVNAFVNKEGKSNFDILKVDSSKKDTSAFKNTFKSIQLNNISLKNAAVSYVDLSSKMKANMQSLDAQFDLVWKNDNLQGVLNMNTPNLSFDMDTIEYVRSAAIKLKLPLALQLSRQHLFLNKAEIALNDLIVKLDGTIFNLPNKAGISTNLKFETSKYPLKSLLKMIPRNYTSVMKGMELDGILATNGTITGIYNQKQIPVVTTNILLKNGTFSYAQLPYKMNDITGDVAVKIDMNTKTASQVQINNFSVRAGQSSIQTKGIVNNILADNILFDLDMTMHLLLQELTPILPKNKAISLKGIADGSAKAKFSMSQLTAMDFAKMDIKGNLSASNLEVVYDTLALNADKANLALTMPNKTAKNKTMEFMLARLSCNQLQVVQGKNTKAQVFGANVTLETSNILNSKKVNSIGCNFAFDLLSASTGTMSANIKRPTGKFTMKANWNDATAIPQLSCNFDIQSLETIADSTALNISYPKGQFSLSANKKNPKLPEINLRYQSTDFAGKMGTQTMAAKQMTVNANIIRDGKQDNTLLQWIPTGHISLEKGLIKADGLKADIQIPTIQFDFTPDEYVIKDSRVVIDKSDFQLKGKLSNITAYLKNTGLLKGDFNFNSNATDVVKLMDLTSGIGNDSLAKAAPIKKTEAASTQSSSSPYMVPKGMDITVHANVRQAFLGTDTARNVLGDLYIKDGTMVLENMKFITTAAKMQLTAVYRTPRKNHLFVGLDFHILDMEISELLKMVPDIDSVMPMLRSFGGKGEFHIAAETYMDSLYNPKKSTLRGVSSIRGENLVLMDGETFSEIAKTLRFSKKTQNKVDSLSAEFTIFKNEVDIYPFLIVMDKYKAVVAGRHNLDMSFNYHISLVDSPLPFRLGVDVVGTMDKMKYSLAKCKYANLYRPVARKEIVAKQLEIRKMIRDALTRNLSK